jgi:hypothetical protein
MLAVRRRDARDRGIPFAITRADILPLPVRCPLLGVPIDYAVHGKGPSPFSPSIDRIRPELGYIPGNVWVVSLRANVIKADGTWQELAQISEALRARLGGNP